MVWPVFLPDLAKQTELTTLSLSFARARSEQVDDATLLIVGKLRQLRHLELSGGKGITAGGIASLAGLDHLDYLGLEYFRDLKRSTLEAIPKAFPNLQTLSLQNSWLDIDGDDGASTEPLVGFTRLKSLIISNTYVSASVPILCYWPNLTTLEHLDLSNAVIDSDSLTVLSNNLGLKSLVLNSPTVVDQTLHRLLPLQKLENLSVPERCLTVSGATAIAQLKGLVSLEGIGQGYSAETQNPAADLEVSKPQLALLAELPRLQYLKLMENAITSENAAEFEAFHRLQHRDARVKVLRQTTNYERRKYLDMVAMVD